MKKSLLFAAAATIALSASAWTMQPLSSISRNVATSPIKVTGISAETLLSNEANVKADETYTLAGTYTLTVGDFYFQGGEGLVETIAEVAVDGDKVTITSSYGMFVLPAVGTYDEAANTITFDNGTDIAKANASYWTRLEPFAWDEDLEDMVPGSFEATFDPATGEISFPADHGFSFPAYDNAECSGDPKGYFGIFDMIAMVPYVEPSGELDLTEWEDLTTATMIDGWLMPALMEDEWETPADYPINDIKVMRNIEDPDLIALIDPYVNAIQGAGSGAIVIDISNPDFVLVLPGVFSGMAAGTNRITCQNIEGFFTAQGYSEEQIKAGLKDITEWSTLKEVDGKSVINVPNCRYGLMADPKANYVWSTDEAMINMMKSTITFATSVGVEAILDNEVEAPAEYFNLQGIRVAEPANGLYIVRQGSKVSKVVK